MAMEINPDKLTAFRAILLNEAITAVNSPESDFFLAITDGMTGIHIRMLRLLSDPPALLDVDAAAATQFKNLSHGSIGALIKAAFPALERGHLESLLGDLHQKSLSRVGRDGYAAMTTRRSILEKQTTEIGERFLAYISLPPECES